MHHLLSTPYPPCKQLLTAMVRGAVVIISPVRATPLNIPKQALQALQEVSGSCELKLMG